MKSLMKATKNDLSSKLKNGAPTLKQSYDIQVNVNLSKVLLYVVIYTGIIISAIYYSGIFDKKDMNRMQHNIQVNVNGLEGKVIDLEKQNQLLLNKLNDFDDKLGNHYENLHDTIISKYKGYVPALRPAIEIAEPEYHSALDSNIVAELDLNQINLNKYVKMIEVDYALDFADLLRRSSKAAALLNAELDKKKNLFLKYHNITREDKMAWIQFNDDTRQLRNEFNRARREISDRFRKNTLNKKIKRGIATTRQ